MAGHSKWSQIKRKKAVTDARRGQLFTKLLREITVAAKQGGDDPAGNARLRTAIQEAKAKNVPNDNIERSIKRGAGGGDDTIYEEVVYEGYGPGGAAILVETLTDNRNRTVADIRHLFSKHGGNLGESGCVGWMFEKRGYLAVDRNAVDEEDLMEIAVEAGAEDVSVTEDLFEIITRPEEFAAVGDRLDGREIAISERALEMVSQNSVDVDPENAPRLLSLMEALEDHDDIQHVWSNFELDADALAEQFS